MKRRPLLPCRLPRKFKKAWRSRILKQLIEVHGKRIVTTRVRLRWNPQHGWTLTARPARRVRKIIKSSAVLNVPKSLCVCPHCSSPLIVSFESWTAWRTGFWLAESVVVECTSEPDLDSDNYDDWAEVHNQMPYVYWLPICKRVEKWVNENYCFDLDGE